MTIFDNYTVTGFNRLIGPFLAESSSVKFLSIFYILILVSFENEINLSSFVNEIEPI